MKNLQTLVDPIWMKWESRILSVISLALELLREAGNLPKEEASLNREFDSCLLEAESRMWPDNEILAHVMECNNQPDHDDQQRPRRENKTPDFQWVIRGRSSLDHHPVKLAFVLECKRLGKQTSSGWNFNENYSHHGIVRFRDSEWGYGQGVASGAMAGYWQDTDRRDVLGEVNKGCEALSLPDLSPVSRRNSKKPIRFKQTLKRNFKVSPFTLHHFWIDIRIKSARPKR